MRIRRICSSKKQYESHAENFIKYFTKRGYVKVTLAHTSNEVLKMNQKEPLNLIRNARGPEQNQIPLVLTWSHIFKEISKIIHHHHYKLSKKCPEFKRTFPEPPLVAYRRTKNIKDMLVRTNHWTNEESK